MKILITGAGGYIGSNILAYLQKKGCDIVGTTENILNKEALKPYFNNIELVIHTAGQVKVPKNEEDYYHVNVSGTKNIIELCLENNCKLIHLSSIATEGAYGKSKQQGQKLVEDYCKNNGLKAIVLRLCGIYNDNKKRKSLSYFLNDLMADIENVIKFHNFNKYELIDYEKNMSKILEALKFKGKPHFIPGSSRSELPEFFKQMGFKKGVEVGVSWAQNIVGYCEAGLEIYGIDPWEDSRDNVYRKIVSIPGERAKTVNDVYSYAVERTKEYPNCKLIRKLSMDALDDFPNRSLDFVYIDANHGFGYVAMDLMQWSQKVKKGGVIAGHDYCSTTDYGRHIRHVGNVVDAFAKSYDFENFWVLGSKDDYVDRESSYFFIKHW